MTKRTIDHYTRLGLLEAARSASNYRYYESSAAAQIHFIEKRKAAGLSLEEIKQELHPLSAASFDTKALKENMQSLQKELAAILTQLEKADIDSAASTKKELSACSLSLIKTLLLLLP